MGSIMSKEYVPVETVVPEWFKKGSVLSCAQYQCRECRATFELKEVVCQKVDGGDIVDPMMPHMPVMQKDGYYFHCPKCHQVHLFGFAVADEPEESEVVA